MFVSRAQQCACGIPTGRAERFRGVSARPVPQVYLNVAVMAAQPGTPLLECLLDKIEAHANRTIEVRRAFRALRSRSAAPGVRGLLRCGGKSLEPGGPAHSLRAGGQRSRIHADGSRASHAGRRGLQRTSYSHPVGALLEPHCTLQRSRAACPLGAPLAPEGENSTMTSCSAGSTQVWVYPYPNTVEETPPVAEMARTSVMWGEFKHGVKRRREKSAHGLREPLPGRMQRHRPSAKAPAPRPWRLAQRHLPCPRETGWR